MNHLDINQIKEIIPHRHPFLLLDYIEDYVPGEYAVGYKCVSYREEFFAGHFPEESTSGDEDHPAKRACRCRRGSRKCGWKGSSQCRTDIHGWINKKQHRSVRKDD